MKIEEIAIGRRVTLNCDQTTYLCAGETGTIIVNHGSGYIGVEFDRNIKGHECLGHGRNGHCWNLPCKDVDFNGVTAEIWRELNIR